MHQQLVKLFETYTGGKVQDSQALTPAGSSRQYFRMTNASFSLIGVIGTSLLENKAFIMLANHFKTNDLNTPKVLAISEDQLCYIQEDLGEISLYSLIQSTKVSVSEKSSTLAFLEKSIRLLPDFQFKNVDNIDYTQCYPQESFDSRMIHFDLNYFKYNFLKLLPLEFHEGKLEDDFDKLESVLLNEPMDSFMLRDFQSRNVMVLNDNPYFIDFQGGRKGPIYYDVASFLWQAKANFSAEIKSHLISIYLEEVQKYQTIDKTSFFSTLRYFVLFRLLQVLGAYGYRGLLQQKKHFIESIPFAINQIKDLILTNFDEFPYLMKILNSLIDYSPLQSQAGIQDLLHKTKQGNIDCIIEPKKIEIDHILSPLTVTITSFSFKKGYPIDESGNGGGYIFDCRGMHNPGRYDAYKQSTGMEANVIRFLEERGEVFQFLNSIKDTITPHIECYIKRGFSHLSIGFGCTGGQHRSVYCAESLAKYIHEKFGIAVNLIHREQKVEKRY